jgi:hypothetical protein
MVFSNSEAQMMARKMFGDRMAEFIKDERLLKGSFALPLSNPIKALNPYPLRSRIVLTYLSASRPNGPSPAAASRQGTRT